MKKLYSKLSTLPKFAKKDSQRGAITVAETLISLGVGTTVLAAVFAGVPALLESRNTSNALSGLTQTATTVRVTFGARNSFDGLTTEIASGLSGFPSLFKNGDSVVHPWGGALEVSGSGQEFTITFEDMPEKGCGSIASATLNLAQNLSIGGTSILEPGEDDGEDTSEFATIESLCSAADNDLVWTFSA